MTTLYRACEGYTGAWSCWSCSVETAEAYRDNPGYGGQEMVTCDVADDARILDLRGNDAWDMLAAAYLETDDYDAVRDQVEEWNGGLAYLYQVWEDRVKVAEFLADNYDWIVHDSESFPANATTWVKLIDSDD